MNKTITCLLALAVCLFSLTNCTNNGMNKPITEELSAEELKANIESKTDFENHYKWCRSLAEWIGDDNMKIAKYGDITYQQLWNVNHSLIDWDNIEAQHLTMFPKREQYRYQADSILNCIEAMCPDSLVKLEFYKKVNYDSFLGTQTKYYFLATPLKGEVEQFSFYFNLSKKIYGKKSIDDISLEDRNYGSQDSPISNTTIVEAYGDRIDLLKKLTTDEIKRDYDFFYTIFDARYKGQNWNNVPDEIRWYIDDFRDNEGFRNIAKEVAIKEYIDGEYISYMEFMQQQRDIILKEKAPKVFSLLNEYNNR